MTLEALLWDVDGTLAETERDGHRIAFNRTFEAFGFAWRWSEERYGELLRVTGGRERMLADFDEHEELPADLEEREALATRMHRQKNRFYAELVRDGGLPFRAGVIELMQDCLAAGVRMGITTTTSRANLEALMTLQLGERWQKDFETVVVGEHVRRKKPDPEVFELALAELGIDAGQAVAIEDSPAGVQAATTAGVPVIVTRSRYFAAAPMPGAIAVGDGLGSTAGWEPPPVNGQEDSRVTLEIIRGWHAAATGR